MHRGLIVLILMVVAAVPVQAQDGQKDFDLLFGDKLKQVRSTSSRADDFQLATEITKAAGSEGLSEELVVLMCETSFLRPEEINQRPSMLRIYCSLSPSISQGELLVICVKSVPGNTNSQM